MKRTVEVLNLRGPMAVRNDRSSALAWNKMGFVCFVWGFSPWLWFGFWKREIHQLHIPKLGGNPGCAAASDVPQSNLICRELCCYALPLFASYNPLSKREGVVETWFDKDIKCGRNVSCDLSELRIATLWCPLKLSCLGDGESTSLRARTRSEERRVGKECPV